MDVTVTMRPVFIASDSLVSPLGLTSDENYDAVQLARTGISLIDDAAISPAPLYAACIQPGHRIEITNSFDSPDHFTWFEQIAIYSIRMALAKSAVDPSSSRVIFVLSTTKGNIELLEQGKLHDQRIDINEAAKDITHFFNNPNSPVIISNACISGVVAMLVAKRLLASGQYDYAIVCGADVLTHFVVSGFQSLFAISSFPCKPFDADRNGITLGEAAATVVLTCDSPRGANPKIKIEGGATTNDANHISGPSRTGEELATAIRKALHDSQLQNDDIAFISAHGTATSYNDEMEAKALNLACLQHTPTHSLKGYFGHTLGAAGIVESVISIHSMLHNELVPSFGFTTMGVKPEVNIIRKTESMQIKNCLKTASGFGGCNAAMVLSKS
jgi:3-oxoacyl-[acyl-carrier-protein] synthase-1